MHSGSPRLYVLTRRVTLITHHRGFPYGACSSGSPCIFVLIVSIALYYALGPQARDINKEMSNAIPFCTVASEADGRLARWNIWFLRMTENNENE